MNRPETRFVPALSEIRNVQKLEVTEYTADLLGHNLQLVSSVVVPHNLVL